MMITIYKFELITWLKKPATYLYFITFFLFSLISFMGTGGYFDEPVASNTSTRILNSPYEINFMLQYLNKLFLFLIPAIIGSAVYRDFSNNVYPILYTFPLRKRDYLLGKFLSALTIVIVITLSGATAFLLGEFLLGSESSAIGVFNGLGYIQAYCLFIIPNMLFYGALVFTVVVLTRNIYAGFISIILIFFFQIIAENLFRGSNFLIAITDPFAQNAVLYNTQSWTLAEKNTNTIPVLGVLLYNRLFWFSITGLGFVLLFNVFSFSQHKLNLERRTSKSKSQSPSQPIESKQASNLYGNYQFNLRGQFVSLWKLSQFEFKYILKGWIFWLFAGLGILAIVFMLARVTNGSDMVMLPLTRIMLAIPAFFFVTIIVLITFIYSGMLVHRARTAHMHQLIDTTATESWIHLGANVLAISYMQFLLLAIMMTCGIALQVINGFYKIELGQYLFNLFILTAPILIVWTFTSIFIHTLFNNLYSGLFTLLFIWVGKEGFSQLGISTHLLRFNTPPQLIYSDMNGYGSSLGSYFLAEGYWLLLACILMLIAFLFWQRGFAYSFRERLIIARSNLNRSLLFALGGFILAFAVFGFGVYKAEDITATTTSNSVLENFKKNFGKYENQIQPRIVSIKLNLGLEPELNSFAAVGEYLLINKSNEAIGTLLIKTGFDEVTNYHLNRKNRVSSRDTIMNFSVHELEEALNPLDSVRIQFGIKSKPNTLFSRHSNVIGQGTFLMQDFLPRLGYFVNTEKKNPWDGTAINNHHQALDSDLVDFETTISTSKNQQAFAAGVLQEQWMENGRNFYTYKTDTPVKFGVALTSGTYEIKTDTWKDKNLEIYFYKGHEYAIDNMMSGLKAALEYNTSYFSPFQHQTIRLIEFPLTEGTFATSLANSILISEVRFGVNATTQDKIDLSFYVAAHELTHQWFGNQIIPKDVLGAIFLSESISEYVTLKIYEGMYGKAKALQFLKLQRERYLKGRSIDSNKEAPLYLVNPDQQHIAYGKGTIAFNTLAHYMGEDNLNKVLKEFVIEHRFKSNPYPTSSDFLKTLKRATPDSLQYLITDFFEEIIFHDNRINTAAITALPNGSYQARLNLEILKYKEKIEASVPLNDLLEVGFYNSDGELISLQSFRFKQGATDKIFQLTQKPYKVVLDPNYLMIDKELTNNSFHFDPPQ